MALLFYLVEKEQVDLFIKILWLHIIIIMDKKLKSRESPKIARDYQPNVLQMMTHKISVFWRLDFNYLILFDIPSVTIIF